MIVERLWPVLSLNIVTCSCQVNRSLTLFRGQPCCVLGAHACTCCVAWPRGWYYHLRVAGRPIHFHFCCVLCQRVSRLVARHIAVGGNPLQDNCMTSAKGGKSNQFSQTWYDARHDWTLQFDTSLNDLVIHSRSQGHRKARTWAVILLSSCLKQLRCSRWFIMSGRWLWRSCVWTVWIISALIFLFLVFGLCSFCYKELERMQNTYWHFSRYDLHWLYFKSDCILWGFSNDYYEACFFTSLMHLLPSCVWLAHMFKMDACRPASCFNCSKSFLNIKAVAAGTQLARESHNRVRGKVMWSWSGSQHLLLLKSTQRRPYQVQAAGIRNGM